MEESAEVLERGAGDIAYRASGQGKPLVLINGFAATKEDWDPTFVSALASHHRVIAPDNRGIGVSGGSPQCSIEDLASDVAELIEALDLDAPLVVGWSMGGFIAQQLAASRPELVAALVLLGTDPGGTLAELGDPTVFKALADTTSPPRTQASALIAALFPQPVAGQIDADFGEVVAAARERLDPDTVRAQRTAMQGWYSTDRMPSSTIDCPTLIAAGDVDAVIPASNSLALAGEVEGSWLARFAGGGHAFMAQFPEQLAALIRLFASSAES